MCTCYWCCCWCLERTNFFLPKQRDFKQPSTFTHSLESRQEASGCAPSFLGRGQKGNATKCFRGERKNTCKTTQGNRLYYSPAQFSKTFLPNCWTHGGGGEGGTSTLFFFSKWPHHLVGKEGEETDLSPEDWTMWYEFKIKHNVHRIHQGWLIEAQLGNSIVCTIWRKESCLGKITLSLASVLFLLCIFAILGGRGWGVYEQECKGLLAKAPLWKSRKTNNQHWCLRTAPQLPYFQTFYLPRI